MRRFLAVWTREMQSCFLSPVAYVLTVLFLAMTGWVFLQMVEGNVGVCEPLPGLLFRVIVFFWLPVLVTMITMRLFADERRSGTIETLLTAPVTEAQVVLGKYAGALSFLVFAVAPAVTFIFILERLSPGIEGVDAGAVAGGCLITLLLAAFCVSIGLFTSLLTCNQIVAAICCFCGVLLPLLAGYLGSMLPAGSDELLAYISAHRHVVDFSRGSVDTRPVVLYLSGTAFMLFASVRQLESRRWGA